MTRVWWRSRSPLEGLPREVGALVAVAFGPNTPAVNTPQYTVMDPTTIAAAPNCATP